MFPATPCTTCQAPGAAFDTFWAAYPLKVSKRAARTAWAKLGPAPPLAAIVDALAWQRELPRWREERGRFIPHPATYLNGRRWEDERPRANDKASSGRWVPGVEATRELLKHL